MVINERRIVMCEKNKEVGGNPAKKVTPTPIPVKDTRSDGKKYRFTLDEENQSDV